MSEDYNKIGGLKVFEFSGFRSDKVCHLRLGFWRNVTRRHGEDGGLLKQSNGSHGGDGGKCNATEVPMAQRGTEV